uniref:Protein FAR1-RELATED SEQUENCE 11 n=1 Tax=Cajanus cajan TaxID=3821 RepID=A0A151TAG0_CAJCA|nr:Protein FAR1-RELATED SEQUENCE 11 [Cajanus cajan]
MRTKLKKYVDIFPNESHLVEFIAEHNHELLSEEEAYFLLSHCTITKEYENRILLLKDAGLRVPQIMRVMESEKNVKHGYLSFIPKDVYNLLIYISSERKNDANDLLHYYQVEKEENCNFQYSYKFDRDRKLEHIFWSPTHCFDWYQKFGDVAFDTTYKINAYDKPFGNFVGIDNQGRTILFGCALLRNETTNAFSWLMKVFMPLKSPKTILTDQQEMPLTKHAFCMWHITSKFSGWFTALLCKQYSQLCASFYQLYKVDTQEEFENQWPQVIEKFNMQNNKHVLGLYGIRRYWVPAYLHDYFFAEMTTIGRSESINTFVKQFRNSHVCLS